MAAKPKYVVFDETLSQVVSPEFPSEDAAKAFKAASACRGHTYRIEPVDATTS